MYLDEGSFLTLLFKFQSPDSDIFSGITAPCTIFPSLCYTLFHLLIKSFLIRISAYNRSAVVYV